MNAPDFEIRAQVRARRLRAKVSPSATVDADDGVRLERARSQRNLPDRMEPDATYSGVFARRDIEGWLRE